MASNDDLEATMNNDREKDLLMKAVEIVRANPAIKEGK